MAAKIMLAIGQVGSRRQRLNSLNCSVPAVSRLCSRIPSQFGSQMIILSRVTEGPTSLECIVDPGIDMSKTVVACGVSRTTHIYLNLLPIWILNCWVVALNPNILHELRCGRILASISCSSRACSARLQCNGNMYPSGNFSQHLRRPKQRYGIPF